MASWALRLAVTAIPSSPLKSNNPVKTPTSHISFPRVLSPPASSVKPIFSRGGYNAQIFVGENESEDSVVRRFRREVFKANVFEECRRRRFFESKQDIKKRKSRSPVKRNVPRRPLEKPTKETEVKDDEEEEDNWELPDRDIGF
jgi:ribosomal protein S21